MLHPEFPGVSIKAGQGEVAVHLRVREEGGIEVQTHIQLLGQIEQKLFVVSKTYNEWTAFYLIKRIEIYGVATAGFKYFNFDQVSTIRLAVGGKCSGSVEISDRSDFANIVSIVPLGTVHGRTDACAPLSLKSGVKPLYFRFVGQGAMDFYAFEIS